MISIIVPVYNVEQYLKRSINSILNSTYRKIEVILVDDGSTDRSGEMCDAFASKDSRVKVIHKKNGGLACARNKGLSLTTGDYVGFIDSDDVIHPNMLQVLHDAITSGDYEFSMVLGQMVNEDFVQLVLKNSENGLNADTRAISQRDFIKGLMGKSENDYQYMVVWNKLYKRSLLQDMRFASTSSEDLEWNARISMKLNRAIFVNAKLYYWIQHETSVTHQPVSLSKIERINSYQIVLNEIPSFMKLERSMCLLKMYKVILHTRYNARNTRFSKEAKDQALVAYRSTIKEYMGSEIPWFKKYTLLLFYHVPWSYSLLMQVAEIMAKLKSH